MQVINTIYNNINSGCEYINRFPITIPESKNLNKKLLNLHNTIYFPDEIQNYIKSHIHYITTYIVNISGKNIYITTPTTIDGIKAFLSILKKETTLTIPLMAINPKTIATIDFAIASDSTPKSSLRKKTKA